MVNNNKDHFGPKFTARTLAHIQDVTTWLQQSARKSIRRLSQRVVMSSRSLCRIIHNDLKLFPYKVQILQPQTQFSNTFSDEVHFHFSGHINRQNFRFWACKQSHEQGEKLLGVEKTTVWCALGKNDILGPYFFEDDDGHQVTVNADASFRH